MTTLNFLLYAKRLKKVRDAFSNLTICGRRNENEVALIQN
jgi:hypothetical protein